MRAKPFRPAASNSESDIASRRAYEARFDALVRAEYARVVTFVRRYVIARDVAEDLVQDVFGNVWKHVERFNFDDPFPYIYRAARNRAMSYLRHQQVHTGWLRRTSGAGEPLAPASATDPEVTELAAAIQRTVDGLPERCRAVFLLSRDRGLSNPEIARTLEISIKTVEAQIAKALRTLRVRLAPFLPTLLAVVLTELQTRLFG